MPGGGYLGFQVTGMMEGFFGFEIFDSGIFLGTKIWQVFFWVAWFEWGFFWVLKRIGSAVAAWFCQ